MNLQQYVQQEPATVAWGVEDEIALEQYIATIDMLAEKEEQLSTALESAEFVVDVARHHPDSPAFEGLGIEARSVLSVSVENGGEGWIKRTWDAIKNTAIKIYEAIRDFFVKLFRGYPALKRRLEKMKEHFSGAYLEGGVDVEVTNPQTLQTGGEVTIEGIKNGLVYMTMVGRFYNDLWAPQMKMTILNFTRVLAKKASDDGFSMADDELFASLSAKSEHADIFTDNIDKVIESYRIGVPRKYMATLGDKELTRPKSDDKFAKVINTVILADANPPMRNRSVDVHIPNDASINEILENAIKCCEEGERSESISKDVLEFRNNLMKEFDDWLKKARRKDDDGKFQSASKAVKLIFFIMRVNTIILLRQYQTTNYRGCRAILMFAEKAAKNANIIAPQEDKEKKRRDSYRSDSKDLAVI